MSNHLPLHFKVQEAGRLFQIDWLIRDVQDPASFLYWALQYDARYRIDIPPARRDKTARDAWLELVPVEGCHGEYHHGLYWVGPRYGNAFRLIAGTHYLCQHGLDGLPARFLREQPKDVPLFLVETRSGAFTMTLLDWWSYFTAGRNEQNLLDLGISVKKR